MIEKIKPYLIGGGLLSIIAAFTLWTYFSYDFFYYLMGISFLLLFTSLSVLTFKKGNLDISFDISIIGVAAAINNILDETRILGFSPAFFGTNEKILLFSCAAYLLIRHFKPLIKLRNWLRL